MMKSCFALRAKSIAIFMTGALCGVAYLISCGKVNTNEAGATGTTARYVKANGTSIGEFLSISDSISEAGGDNLLQVPSALSSTGYIIPIRRNGEIDRGSLLFSSADCTGQAHVQSALNKSIFRCHNSLYYVSPSAAEIELTTNSRLLKDTGVCESYNTIMTVIPVQTNNSSVTGVSQTSFTPPITIE